MTFFKIHHSKTGIFLVIMRASFLIIWFNNSFSFQMWFIGILYQIKNFSTASFSSGL